MTDAQWYAWRTWYEQQVADELAHPDDCIPAQECECPPRGQESE